MTANDELGARLRAALEHDVAEARREAHLTAVRGEVRRDGE
ncbi:MAG: hypothetical protein ACRDUY_12280 [Nitriliruptorales bacterium]